MSEPPAEPPPPPPPAPAPAPAAPPPGKRHLLLKTLVVLFLLATCAVLFRNFLVRKGMETAVTEVTGFPLVVGDFDLGLTNSRVAITDLHLNNPEGFEDPRCLQAKRIVADLEGRSLFGKELHIEELVLDIPQVVVVKNAKGETNLDRLKALGGDGKEAKEPAKGRKEEKPLQWRCDRMHLKMGKVIFLDYSAAKDGKPKKDEWKLDVDEKFKDVDGPDRVVRIIVLKVVTKTPIKLVSTTAEALKDGVVGIVGGAADAVKGVGESIGDLFGGDDDAKKDAKKDGKKKRK